MAWRPSTWNLALSACPRSQAQPGGRQAHAEVLHRPDPSSEHAQDFCRLNRRVHRWVWIAWLREPTGIASVHVAVCIEQLQQRLTGRSLGIGGRFSSAVAAGHRRAGVLLSTAGADKKSDVSRRPALHVLPRCTAALRWRHAAPGFNEPGC